MDFREGKSEEVRIEKAENVRSGCSKWNNLHMKRPRGIKQHSVSREMQTVLYSFQGRGEESKQGPAQGELLLTESKRAVCQPRLDATVFFHLISFSFKLVKYYMSPEVQSTKSNSSLETGTSS